MTVWIGLGAVALLVALYGVSIYNRLVALRQASAKAWSNIDVLLVQRNEELPKLVETCRQHMRYEQETLGRVTQARSLAMQARAGGDLAALGRAEASLQAGLGQLFALVEQYPDLRASESFLHLHGRISGLENAIADRREFYNESANLYNTRIESFPELLLAALCGFRRCALLRFEAARLADPDLRGLFGG